MAVIVIRTKIVLPTREQGYTRGLRLAMGAEEWSLVGSSRIAELGASRIDLLVSNVTFPATEDEPQADGVVVIVRGDTEVFLVEILASAEDWPAQERTLRDSALGLLLMLR